MDRRQFIEGALAASGWGMFPSSRATESSHPCKVPHATLERTGQSVSRLGVGCGIYIRGTLTPGDMAT